MLYKMFNKNQKYQTYQEEGPHSNKKIEGIIELKQRNSDI